MCGGEQTCVRVGCQPYKALGRRKENVMRRDEKGKDAICDG